MKTDIKKSTSEWMTKITGDPFVDCGGFVINYLSEKFPEKGILELVEFATIIYVNDWKGSIHPFFLNSKITQPSFKGEKKIQETLIYFDKLIEEKIDFKTGFCRITGQNTKLFYAGRDNFILSGSGTFINFHHFFEEGIFVSKEVLIRMFFVPLGVMYLGGKIALLQSNDTDVTEFFIRNNCKKNLEEISIKKESGILKSEFNNPTNALFELANECIREIKKTSDNEKDVTINLYHFTNFGASPLVDIHTFPAVLFKFYKYCLSYEFREDWRQFVYLHYKNSKFRNAKLNRETKNYEASKKKTTEIIDYNSYKKWYNIIYAKLLEGKSILPNILHFSKENIFNFKIVKLYQKLIRNMETKTLNKIEQLADFIIQDEDRLKKNITRLNGTKRSFELRSFLLSLIKKNYEDGGEKPLVTLTEYVEYLFPDGTYWADIRDLMLIAIYQKLHEKNIKIEVPNEEPEIKEEEEK